MHTVVGSPCVGESLQLQVHCGPFCHAGAPQCAACLGDGAEIILNYYIFIQTIMFAFLFPVILLFGYQAFSNISLSLFTSVESSTCSSAEHFSVFGS